MREIDAKSLVVAAVIGALFLWLITKRTKSSLLTGALTGMVVQVGLRTFGVS